MLFHKIKDLCKGNQLVLVNDAIQMFIMGLQVVKINQPKFSFSTRLIDKGSAKNKAL